MSKRKVLKQTSIEDHINKRPRIIPTEETKIEVESGDDIQVIMASTSKTTCSDISQVDTNHSISDSNEETQISDSLDNMDEESDDDDYDNNEHSLRKLGEEGTNVQFNSKNEICCNGDSRHNDDEYVNMPNEFSKRWSTIKRELEDVEDFRTFKKAVTNYNNVKHNLNFRALKGFLKEFPEKNDTLIKIAKFATKLQDFHCKKLPYLQSKTEKCITLGQYQIACLLANGFCCTFERRDKNDSLPDINFGNLFYCDDQDSERRKFEKLRCIFSYFDRIIDRKKKGFAETCLTFDRRYCRFEDIPDWKENETQIGLEKFFVTEKEIHQSDYAVVDFANKYIGGGVLGRGLVQEEIMFLQNPELIVSRLFTQKLESTDCLVITGFENFNKTTGYASSFKFAEESHDKTHTYPLNKDLNQRFSQTIAIDALHFRDPNIQYEEKNLIRELNKAYIGFHEKNPKSVALATGNWGCGAFRGDKELKFLIQLMAATETRREVYYSTFGDYQFERKIRNMYKLLKDKKKTVKDIYKYIREFGDVIYRGDEYSNVFDYIFGEHLQ